MQYEDIHDLVGHMGAFQICLVLIACAFSFYDAEPVTMVFVGGSMAHFCRVDRLANLSQSRQREIAVPRLDDTETGFSSCRVFDFNFDNLTDDELASWNRSLANESLDSVECSAWVFDQSEFVSTIVSRFDFVCDKAFLTQLVSTVFMIGGLFGSLLSGNISDRFGRRRGLQIFMSIRIASTILFTFAPNYPLFIIGRFLLGFGGNGVRVTSYVIVMETISKRYRSVCVTIVVMTLSCGIIIVSLIASAVRDDFRFQVAFFFPQILLLPFVFMLLPESPRWLFTREKYDELNKLFQRIAVINGKTLPQDFDSRKFEKLHTAGASRRGCADLLLTPRMRLRTIVIVFVWFTFSLVYYALVLNISTLPGNLYVNTCINGAVEIPGLAIGTLALRTRLGRRFSTFLFLLLCGLSNLTCVPLIIYDFVNATTVVSLVGKMWLMACSGVFILYTSELFPTEVRNIALGSTLMASRIGSAITPYMGENLTAVWKPLPSTVLGGLATVASAFILLLPETRGKPIFDTIQQIEESTSQTSERELSRQIPGDNDSTNNIVTRENGVVTKNALDSTDVLIQNYEPNNADVNGNIVHSRTMADGDSYSHANIHENGFVSAKVGHIGYHNSDGVQPGNEFSNKDNSRTIQLGTDNTVFSHEFSTQF